MPMNKEIVHVTAPLQIWRGEKGAWTFLSITGEPAAAVSAHELVRRLELGRRRGFGSVKIVLRIGASEANTSVFPMQEGGWFLPVKAAIRRAEGLTEGDEVTAELELL